MSLFVPVKIRDVSVPNGKVFFVFQSSNLMLLNCRESEMLYDIFRGVPTPRSVSLYEMDDSINQT